MHQILYISPDHRDLKLMDVVDILLHLVTFLVESVKTTFMKNKSTWVLGKNQDNILDVHFMYYCIFWNV